MFPRRSAKMIDKTEIPKNSFEVYKMPSAIRNLDLITLIIPMDPKRSLMSFSVTEGARLEIKT